LAHPSLFLIEALQEGRKAHEAPCAVLPDARIANALAASGPNRTIVNRAAMALQRDTINGLVISVANLRETILNAARPDSCR
jgi:hypothetical protein